MNESSRRSSSATNANNDQSAYDLDGSTFDADKYLQRVLKNCTLKEVMDTETIIVKDTQTLHSDMQTLVYENYNKFISATDTIRKMKTDFKQMETEMSLLMSKMSTINEFSGQITGTLQGTRQQLSKLSEKHSLLQKLQFLSSLPSTLKTLKTERNYKQAVHDYVQAQKVLQQYGNQPSFQGIQSDCDRTMDEIRAQLKLDFDAATASAHSLAAIGDLLLQLDVRPADLARDMLTSATQRLHQQIVILHDQTERDMMEFVDLSIEGFLNDLTLVVGSYSEMFFARNVLNRESDQFADTAMHDLNAFVSRNMDEYLALVQVRVDVETGRGDTGILLRALDRLHRRLIAMKGLKCDVDTTKTGMEIIINAAKALCSYHLKNLREFFADSISSVRLSLASGKVGGDGATSPLGSGGSSGGSPSNLNELIAVLFESTVEKVKGVLQDLMVFLQPELSFNLKHYSRGMVCIEGIREHLLVGFLKHIAFMMATFSDAKQTCPANLHLVLSKTCLEFDKSGARVLLSLVDDLYGIDSSTLTPESLICTEMREAAQKLLDAYVRLQGLYMSQMLRKSVETRDWLNCLEPRSVRAVMKRVVEELATVEATLGDLYETGNRTAASSDSSRKTHISNNLASSKQQQFRSNWSNYTPTQLEHSFVSNIHRLFSERVEIFGSVDFSKVAILTGIVKISLKTLMECVRLRTFSRFGLQQVQVDTHYLQMNLWRFVSDENLILFLLDEVLGSAVHRCLEPNLMEPNAVEIICERG